MRHAWKSLLCLALACGSTDLAQAQLGSAWPGGFQGWESIEDAEFHFDPDEGGGLQFKPRAPSDVRFQITRAEELLRQGALDAGIRLLQGIFDLQAHTVVQVADQGQYRYVGAAEWGRFVLLRSSAAARAAYERTTVDRYQENLEKAIADRDLKELRRIARRFANSSIGQRALLYRARLHRLAGDRQLAEACARRALDFEPAGSGTLESLRSELQAEVLLCGGALPFSVPPASAPLSLAGRVSTLEDVREIAPIPAPDAPDRWPTYGGRIQRDRNMEAPRNSLRLSDMYHFATGPEGMGDDPVLSDLLNPLPMNYDKAQPPLQPVRDGEVLLVNNSLSVKSFDLYSKTLRWEFKGPLLAGLPPQDWFGVDKYTSYRRSEDLYRNTISKGLVTGLTTARGVVIANLQVPEPTRSIDSIQRIVINPAFPWRGLFALDEASGRLRWSQRGTVKQDPFRRVPTFDVEEVPDPGHDVVSRLNVMGPVSVVDDQVFALGHFVEGAVNSHLLVMDLFSGKLIYSVPLVIGQQELSMFGMPFQEFASSTPVVGGSTVFCPTNLGLVAAVDLVFGDLRWLASYDALPIESAPNYYNNNPRPVYWYPNPPMVKDDLLLVTPHDSRRLHVLDTRTGKLRWQYDLGADPRRRNDWNYGMARPVGFLLGCIGDVVVVQDGELLLGLDLQTGRRAWSQSIARSVDSARSPEAFGRGCIASDLVYVPLEDRLVVLDSSGRELESRPWPDASPVTPNARRRTRIEDDRESVAGNVLVFPDLMVVSNRYRISVAFDVDTVLRDLRNKVSVEGASAELLSRIGGLLRRQGNLEESIETFQQGLDLATKAQGDEATRAALHRGIAESSLDLARREWGSKHFDRALEILAVAEQHAVDYSLRAEVTRVLVDEFADRAQDAWVVSWLGRLRELYGDERDVFRSLSAEKLPVGLMVGVELARHHLAMGRAQPALAELQRMQIEYGTERMFGIEVKTWTVEQVDRLLVASDPGLRRNYDAEAWHCFEEAFAAQDVERLTLLRQRYANASRMDEFVGRLVDLLAQRERYAEVLVAGLELLGRSPLEPRSVVPFSSLVEAAARLGNQSMARALRDEAVRLGLPVDLDGELLAELDRRPMLAQPTGAPRELRSFTLDGEEIVGSSALPISGEPLDPRNDQVLVLSGNDTLSAAGLDDGEPRWTRSLGSGERRQNSWYLKFVHVADVLIVGPGDLLAIDTKDGQTLWLRESAGALRDIETHAGVLLLVEQRPGGGDSGIDLLVLTALEPHSGARLWQRTLRGNGKLQAPVVADGRVAVVTSGERIRLEVFDVLTGRPCFEAGDQETISAQSAVIFVPGRDRILVPQMDSTAGALQASLTPDELVAYDLDSGEPSFRVSLRGYRGRVRDSYFLGGSLILRVQVPLGSQEVLLALDPDTGVERQVLEVKSLSQVVLPDGAADCLVAFESNPKDDEGRRAMVIGADLVPRWDRMLAVRDRAVKIRSFATSLQRGSLLLLAGDRRLPNSLRVDLEILRAEDGQSLDHLEFDVGDSVRSNWSVGMVGNRLLVITENTVRVFAWED